MMAFMHITSLFSYLFVMAPFLMQYIASLQTNFYLDPILFPYYVVLLTTSAVRRPCLKSSVFGTAPCFFGNLLPKGVHVAVPIIPWHCCLGLLMYWMPSKMNMVEVWLNLIPLSNRQIHQMHLLHHSSPVLLESTGNVCKHQLNKWIYKYIDGFLTSAKRWGSGWRYWKIELI